MSAGSRGQTCRRARIFLLLGVPGISIAGAKDHDRIRICFDPNFWDASITGVSRAIGECGEPVLPPLPQIDIPARRREVPSSLSGDDESISHQVNRLYGYARTLRSRERVEGSDTRRYDARTQHFAAT